MGSRDQQKYFIVLDLGTTSTRAHVIDKNFVIRSGARFETKLIPNDEGMAELDPEVYFKNILEITRDALSSANVDATEVISFGFCCQRATFITWDKTTGEPLHNLITWKDERGAEAAKKFNKSLLLKSINIGSKFMYTISRQDFFKSMIKLKVGKSWLNQRLQYFVKNNEKLKRAIKADRAIYGALDTWLLNRFLNRSRIEHISDVTSSAGTGIYNTFQDDFSMAMLLFFDIKRSILPKVVSNSHDFGCVHESFFGVPIKIAAIISDQSASMIANCCFEKWSSKITLGTGAFLQVNVGEKCIGSRFGPKPLVAWSIKTSQPKFPTIYKLECFYETSADSINFIKTVGLCDDVSELASIANSVEDSDGVFFVPEINGFVGIKPKTTKSHLIRAVLENIALTIGHFYFVMKMETSYYPNKIRIDGGIAQNDFICQQIANLTGVRIERADNCSQLTSIGCAILAAFNCGILKKIEDANDFYKSEKLFIPDMTSREKSLKKYAKYRKMMKKFKLEFCS